MKKLLLRGFNLILSSLLALLGFESCDQACEYGPEPLVEYGSPHADYIFKGKVTNPQGKPVEGERIVVKPIGSNGNPKHPYYYDTLYTDKKGEICSERHEFPANKFRFVAEDPMGKYEKDSVDVLPKQMEKGDGRWYDGKFEVSADFKLQEKEE